MQYEPIKEKVGAFFSRSFFSRKILYLLLDLLLLRSWHVRRALRKIVSLYPGEASVLDAGTGFGQYSWHMSKLGKKWRIKAVDINEDEIETCKSMFMKGGLSDRVTFEAGDLTTLKDNDLYHIILCVDVMEHIEDDVLVFSNFYRSLKKNGTLIISTPSDKGGSDVHSDGERSFIDEHVREGYSISDITRKLQHAGFNSVNTVYTYGKPGNLSWHLTMKYPVKMVNYSSLFFILLPFYYLIFFPVALIFNILDLCISHHEGTGLLVTVRK